MRAAGLVVAVVAACGGGEDTAPDAAACVPSSASSTPVVLGTEDGVDVDSAAAFDGTRTTVVFDSFDVAFSRGRLWEADLHAPGAPHTLALGDEALIAAPSRVGDFLYFVAAGGLAEAPAIWRAPVIDGVYGAREAVGAIDGVDGVLSWPRFVGLPDGRVAVAFHDGAGRPSIAFSEDGLAFGAVSVVDDQARAMAKVEAFADGSLAYTFQTGAYPMISTVRVAPAPAAGQAPVWSAPIVVTDASQNVHDTSAVARADGGLDLYYIYPPVDGFRVFRRAFASDGRLGPEEPITGDASGDASKPRAIRIDGCGVLLTYAEITDRDEGGAPVQQRLGAVVLDGDAPPVP